MAAMNREWLERLPGVSPPVDFDTVERAVGCPMCLCAESKSLNRFWEGRRAGPFGPCRRALRQLHDHVDEFEKVRGH